MVAASVDFIRPVNRERLLQASWAVDCRESMWGLVVLGSL